LSWGTGNQSYQLAKTFEHNGAVPIGTVAVPVKRNREEIISFNIALFQLPLSLLLSSLLKRMILFLSDSTIKQPLMCSDRSVSSGSGRKQKITNASVFYRKSSVGNKTFVRSLDRCLFLCPNFRNSSENGQIAYNSMLALYKGEYILMDIPTQIYFILGICWNWKPAIVFCEQCTYEPLFKHQIFGHSKNIRVLYMYTVVCFRWTYQLRFTKTLKKQMNKTSTN
jgi:hypothetical protein